MSAGVARSVRTRPPLAHARTGLPSSARHPRTPKAGVIASEHIFLFCFSHSLRITDRLCERRMFQGFGSSFSWTSIPSWPRCPFDVTLFCHPHARKMTAGPSACCTHGVYGASTFSLGLSPAVLHCTLGLLSARRSWLHTLGVRDVHLARGTSPLPSPPPPGRSVKCREGEGGQSAEGPWA